MENDDVPVGRILSRRDALKLLGVTGAAILAGCAPGLSGTAGPAGAVTSIPSVATAGTLPACVVRPAMTEGPYFVDEKLNRSDIRSDPGFNTKGKKFLRGYQVTDTNGIAQFTTIYPGWYQGRTVHIHFKIRSDAGSGSVFDFTSQLFFDDALTDQVHAQAPYASKGQRTLRNEGDNIFQNGGDQLMLPLVEAAAGYATTFDIGLNMA